tara:strand:- start:454 stop:1062 length:609 start_codon:yes stop_codon:yes gene_type:complete
MLSLSNSLTSVSSVENIILPIGGNYIFLRQSKVSITSATGLDGSDPQRPAQVISTDEIVFDDTEIEEYAFPAPDSMIYSDRTDMVRGDNMNPTLSIGDSVTLSGRITQADTTSTYEAANANANIKISLNSNSDDSTSIYIDRDNTISGSPIEVAANGDFTRTFTLSAAVVRLQIQSGDVGIEPADDAVDPGVRISNLSLVKN